MIYVTDELYNKIIVDLYNQINLLNKEIDILNLTIENMRTDIAQIKYQMKRDIEPDLRYML